MEGNNEKAVRMSRKEIRKLLHSNITSEYKWFRNFLLQHKKSTISDGTLQSLVPEKQQFIRDMYRHLIKQAGLEWEPSPEAPVEDMSDDSRKWKRCALCKRPNRYIFYIRNKITNKVINVGSECIKEFSDINIPAHQLIEGLKKIERLSKLLKHFSNLDLLISRWSEVLDTSEILIPENLEDKYLIIGAELKILHDKYLDKKSDDTIFSQISELLKDREEILERIEEYVTKNKQNEFVVTRDVIWSLLKSPNGQKTLQMLKRTGYFDWSTVHRVDQEITFMNMIVSKLKGYLDKYDIRIMKVQTEQRGYTYRTINDLSLFILHSELLLSVGGVLFGETIDDVSTTSIIKQSVVKTRSALRRFAEVLQVQMASTNKMEVFLINSEFNEIVFHNVKTKGYVLENLDQLINKFKLDIAFDGNIIAIEEYLQNPSRKNYIEKDLFDFYMERKQFSREEVEQLFPREAAIRKEREQRWKQRNLQSR